MSVELKNTFVSKSISKLYLESDLADIYFAFTMHGETIQVPAHKNILAVASPVFRAMFFGPMKEKDVVNIVDVDVSVFKEFLKFFYLSEVTLSMDNIEAVAQLVDKYDMTECLNSCMEFLKNELTVENMIWGYQLAISIDNEILKEFCQNQMQFLTSDYYESDIFLQCDREVLKNILQLEALSCSEFELFIACIAWAKSSCQSNDLDENDPKNLRNQLADCFYLIRFGAMQKKEIDEIMSNEQYKVLFTTDEMDDISNSKSLVNFQSKVFENASRMSLKWDSDNILTCDRTDRNPGRTGFRPVMDSESVWFSTNAPVLLGAFSWGYFHCRGERGNYKDTKFAVNVIEYQEKSFFIKHRKTTGAHKVLSTGTMESHPNIANLSVSLTRPILINPKKLYEIRSELVPYEFETYQLHHGNSWISEVKLDESLTVYFHHGPVGERHRSGMVEKLIFNRISK